ncbi:15851_t:CDS:2, partial [Gigaspora rosea]
LICDNPIELDPTEFVTNELIIELRTIPFTRLVHYIQTINENNEIDDTCQILQHFEEYCMDNIPIPIYLLNDSHSQKVLKVLNEFWNILATRNYHLFISIN